MSGQRVGAVRTHRTTPNCRVTQYCSGQLCVGSGSALHYCSLPCPHVLLAFNVPPTARLAGAWCQLVVMRLRRYAHSLKGDHDGYARGISVYFNSTYTVGPSRGTWRSQSCPALGSWSRGTRGGPGAAPGWATGARAVGHVVAPELPRAGQRELEPRDTWQREAHLSREARPGVIACVAARGYTPCSLP
jgi:hypothetical protein